MNQQLWNQILACNLDTPFSEYGFSLRLAHEHYWTKDFTQLAILEYKKFMYLAATSEMMVSPSGIIDIVWHQHLIFTQSYQSFCEMLGKQVQHVPSTHNKEDFQKFRQAKERTRQLYEETFGAQPSAIWGYDTMYDSLHLTKAKIKIRSFINMGILVMFCLLIPFYIVLKPVYAQIDNPYFIYALFAIALAIYLMLHPYNQYRLKKIVEGFSQDSFVYRLLPLELVYLKTTGLENVINGVLNEMLEKGAITLNKDVVAASPDKAIGNRSEEEVQVVTTLQELGPTPYSRLLAVLMNKPVFSNIENSMDALKKYVYKSGKFGKLLYLNFSAAAILLLLSATRVITGIARDKPVFLIIAVTFLLILAAIVFIEELTQQLATKTIPEMYAKRILPSRPDEGNWQWSYFLIGTAVLTSSFNAIIDKKDKSGWGGSDTSSSSCGSNCGSSCSSCGGCGGD